jgi:[DsrC]-trisulfide reductase subunit J
VTLIVRFVLLWALLIGGATLAQAQERSSLLPNVPKATGEPHPEGNEFWRKNHPDMLRHDRNLTVRDGEREIGASLKSCFQCHTATDDQGTVLTSQSPNHFCSACHQYVAVKIDCFVCHRSTPDGVDEYEAQAALLPPIPLKDADLEGIIAYLKQGEVAADPPDTSKPAEVGQ